MNINNSHRGLRCGFPSTEVLAPPPAALLQAFREEVSPEKVLVFHLPGSTGEKEAARVLVACGCRALGKKAIRPGRKVLASAEGVTQKPEGLQRPESRPLA